MGYGMNLNDDEIVSAIVGLYYYEQELDSQEQRNSFTKVVNLRDKLEDYLLTSQSPKYAVIYADFIKAVAQTMEEKKMNKRIEEGL